MGGAARLISQYSSIDCTSRTQVNPAFTRVYGNMYKNVYMYIHVYAPERMYR